LTTAQIRATSGWRRRKELPAETTSRDEEVCLAHRILDLDNQLAGNAGPLLDRASAQAPRAGRPGRHRPRHRRSPHPHADLVVRESCGWG